MLGGLRKARGLLKKDLASAVGRSASSITLWEQGKRIPRRADVISLLAEALEVTEEEHLGLLRAAGLGREPATNLEIIGHLRDFLTNPDVKSESKIKLLGLIEASLKVMEIKDAGFDKLSEEDKKQILTFIKSKSGKSSSQSFGKKNEARLEVRLIDN